MKHVKRQETKHEVSLTKEEVKNLILRASKKEAGYSEDQEFEKEEIKFEVAESDKRKKDHNIEVSVEVILINPLFPKTNKLKSIPESEKDGK